MRHQPIDPKLFIENRANLAHKLPAGAIAVVNANDVPPTNADGSLVMVPNSDLFYLSGIEQEESILVLAPHAFEEKFREILFIREPNALLKTWEGYKHSKEDAEKVSGIKTVRWLSDFPGLFRQLMCEARQVYLNRNEHGRAVDEVESRDARFITATMARYPLHTYHRLAPLLHALRAVKSAREIALIQQACAITRAGFLRVLRKTKPGVNECDIEAEFAHEFIRRRGRFAYNPIIAAGANSCVLHYNQNDQVCKKGQVLLLDVGASYANYNADLTRTIPVSGRFSRRQKAVYNAVLRVMRACIAGAVPGKLHRDWQKESQVLMNEELLGLGLITKADIRKQKPDNMACRKYYMHGLGHSLGLDVHDVTPTSPAFAPGWVLTVEPGIYIEAEGFGIRLENDILVTENGPVDLMADIPVETDEIEALMNR